MHNDARIRGFRRRIAQRVARARARPRRIAARDFAGALLAEYGRRHTCLVTAKHGGMHAGARRAAERGHQVEEATVARLVVLPHDT